MARFQPEATISIKGFKAQRNRYSTYRLLKKHIPELQELSVDGEVHVSRSRRGEWGEWYEIWKEGKIVEQGWM